MELDPRKDPTRHCAKVADWPEQDQIAWAAANREGDFLEPDGLSAGWAPITRNAIAESYGRWVTWLAVNDLLTGAPAERVTADALARYMADLSAVNAGSTVVGRLSGLHLAIRAMAPGMDWRWMKRFESKARQRATPALGKRGRLVPADELLTYGQALMRDAEALARMSPAKLAAQYRDGLMIAWLAVRPLRLKNFAAIEIGRHLIAQSNGYWIRFGGDETKTHVPIDAPFPAILTPPLERYLTHHRRILADRTNKGSKGLPPARNALWVSAVGSAMSQGAIYDHLTKRTEARFGHHINPHLFRDCAATSIATEDPEHVQITKSVLGHASLKTSENHYNHARSIEASKRHHAVIEGLRRRIDRPSQQEDAA
jgi:integrase